MKQYDIVVVGAGIAGMSAALRCQLSGKKTLLIEQHNLPGGCASSFVRGRFEIEPSLHEACDIGSEEEPGDVREVMKEYGVKLNWLPVPDCFRMISMFSDGSPMDVTMPHGVDNFINQMEKYVPGSKSKMHDLFDLYEEIRQGTGYISASAGHADSAVLKRDYPNMLRTGAYSTSEVFKAMKLPQKCQDILSVYWSYLGVDMNHLPFIHYASMMQRYVRLGAYIPAHTSHEFSNAYIKRFRELGGEVWYNCRAEKFIFEGDKVVGVQTTMGDVGCKVCLPNINPDIIYGKMIPKERVPVREKKLCAARKGKFGARMYTAYFALDCDYKDIGITNYSYFLAGSSDSEDEYNRIQAGMDQNNFLIFLCYNVANPEMTPKGTCLCSITSMGSPNDWNDVEQKDYRAQKEKMLDKFLEILKQKTGIDMSGHIEEVSIASPWTFARYLNTPEGCVYGYEAREWDGMMPRMMMLRDDFPIKGLRPIGASGPRSDGYSGCTMTGNIVGKLAVKDIDSKAV